MKVNSRSPLQVQAYDYLKDMILSGKLEPDTLYSETRMSAEIGISRTPMREAIQCLSQDGYITVVPSKGFMLRQLNEKDMKETIQIRCAIEGFCMQNIAAEIEGRKGQALLKVLDKHLSKMDRALNAKDGPNAANIRAGAWSTEKLNVFMECDHQFHLALIDYVENEEFKQIFQRLMYLIHLTTKASLGVPGRTDDTLKEHRLIYQYLSQGDGDAAYKLMMIHLMMPLTMHLVDENNHVSEENA
jgi:DNA-binding GntR family transcriptional regulator